MDLRRRSRHLACPRPHPPQTPNNDPISPPLESEGPEPGGVATPRLQLFPRPHQGLGFMIPALFESSSREQETRHLIRKTKLVWLRNHNVTFSCHADVDVRSRLTILHLPTEPQKSAATPLQPTRPGRSSVAWLCLQFPQVSGEKQKPVDPDHFLIKSAFLVNTRDPNKGLCCYRAPNFGTLSPNTHGMNPDLAPHCSFSTRFRGSEGLIPSRIRVLRDLYHRSTPLTASVSEESRARLRSFFANTGCTGNFTIHHRIMPLRNGAPQVGPT